MKKLLTYLHQTFYLWRLAKIETKLFARHKKEEKELRRKFYSTAKPPHFKLWWAAMIAMEKRQEKEYTEAVQTIAWMKPKTITVTRKSTNIYEQNYIKP